MKINWGTGIVIAFVCFISFILYFVYNMMVGDRFNHDLVVDDYYKQELSFQNDITKEQNARTLEDDVTWTSTDKGILIQFPTAFKASNISGTVSLYRPSNKALDFQLPIKVENHTFLIPKDRLLDGRWDMKVDWKNNDSSYLFKESITY
ncbi:FixH family protein [Formosa haliotis]|uniref:FixH family protein n=1 Tax=Formosa haliotis TaxID=1555194 RepID=UPI00082541FF|nr:FixH family protein [Formosa haliotis]